MRDGFCNVCGAVYDALDIHRCEAKRLKKIDDSRKAHEETGIVHTANLHQRLTDGFAMMDDDYEGDDNEMHGIAGG